MVRASLTDRRLSPGESPSWRFAGATLGKK
jgi:hypothetical protein